MIENNFHSSLNVSNFSIHQNHLNLNLLNDYKINLELLNLLSLEKNLTPNDRIS